MLSVLLLILKIIGLILLWTLIVVLAIILIIMIVPIRYRVRADVHGTYDIQARVTWLLRIITFSFTFKDKQLTNGLKVFGIPLGSKKDKKSKEEIKEKSETGEKTETEEKHETAEKPEVSADKTDVRPDETAKPAPEITAAPQEVKAEEQKEASPEKKEKPEKEKKEKKEKKDKKEKEASENTEEVPLPEKIIETLRKIKYKISEIIHKFDPDGPLMQKVDFITNLRTKHAIGLVLRFVGKLLKHILPRKGSGYIHYGFDDPSLTGRILAGAAALTPLHKNEIRIQPDFQEKVFEMDAVLNGKIVFGYIVVKAVALVLKRDVLFVLKNYKKYF